MAMTDREGSKTQAHLEPRDVEHSRVVMSQIVLPMHTGPGGVWAHGGEIIKLMDSAAGLAALRHCHSPVVTLRIEGINFLHPIRVGNFVKVDARLTYVSNSTMEVLVEVDAEDVLNERDYKAITAYFVFIALGDDMKPREVPPLKIESADEQRLNEAGKQRHDMCRIDEMGRVLCAL